jgi:hypothetical protein
MGFWETTLAALGGNVAAMALVGGLARPLVEKYFARDLEAFKADLQMMLVRFSSLHEKRASVVAETYRLLVEAYHATESFASPMQVDGEPEKAEKFRGAMNAMARYFRYFDTHRIYFPTSLCVQLEHVVKELRTQALGYGIYLSHDDEGMSDEGRKAMQKAWMKAWDYMKDDVPAIRLALEDELRLILGANDRAPRSKNTARVSETK